MAMGHPRALESGWLCRCASPGEAPGKNPGLGKLSEYAWDLGSPQASVFLPRCVEPRGQASAGCEEERWGDCVPPPGTASALEGAGSS